MIELLEAPIQALGYELIDVNAPAGPNGVLRVYIDHEAGVNLDDCELVSRQISAVLDVAGPLPGKYVLEVSSPGLNRPLRTREHFQRYCNHVVKVRPDRARDGYKNFTGRLVSVEDQELVVEVDKETFRLALSDIASAQLVYEH